MTPDDQLEDDVLHHTLNLFRYSAAQVAETVARLRKMEKRLLAELKSQVLTQAKKSEIKDLLNNAEKIINDYYAGVQGTFDFEQLGETIAKAQAQSLEIALGLEAAGLPAQSYFASLASSVLIEGAPSAAWWGAQEADYLFKFTAQLRQGLANGEGNLQIIGRIVGLQPTVERNAASLVQTSVQAVANDARRNTFLKNADVIAGIKQVSTLDSHTSLICIAYSGACWDLDFVPIRGNVLPYNGGVPRHWNCRSAETAITKTFREMGLNIDEAKPTTRASDEGQISAATTFDDFLKRKGQAYQDEVLGKGRADLWRSGKLTLKDLVNGQGRPLTLGELQAIYGI